MTTDRLATARLILDRCDTLAAFTQEPGAITRPYGSDCLNEAMDLVAGWMHEAGMTTRRDAAGNLIARLAAADPAAPALIIGSHLDSVRDAGRYDGPLGVLLGLAVAASRAGAPPLPFHLDVTAFADEEGLRFHTTYLGSRAFSGCFTPDLLDLTDHDGVKLREAAIAMGGDPDRLAGGGDPPGALLGYVEAHIEQGPALETLDSPLAVVTAIAGQTRIALALTGEAGHAGTVAMNLRRDALAAASEIVLAVEDLARQTPGLLATVGDLRVQPCASNVIAGRVDLTLDIRSPEDATREQAVLVLQDRAAAVAAARGLAHDWREVQSNAAVPMDEHLSAALLESIAAAGYPRHRLPSGAGHDPVIMSRVCPVAMLFVRCTGGISHNPAEAVMEADVAAAFAALADLPDRLARDFPVPAAGSSGSA
jgi:allantoate deiminase